MRPVPLSMLVSMPVRVFVSVVMPVPMVLRVLRRLRRCVPMVMPVTVTVTVSVSVIMRIRLAIGPDERVALPRHAADQLGLADGLYLGNIDYPNENTVRSGP